MVIQNVQAAALGITLAISISADIATVIAGAFFLITQTLRGSLPPIIIDFLIISLWLKLNIFGVHNNILSLVSGLSPAVS